MLLIVLRNSAILRSCARRSARLSPAAMARALASRSASTAAIRPAHPVGPLLPRIDCALGVIGRGRSGRMSCQSKPSTSRTSTRPCPPPAKQWPMTPPSLLRPSDSGRPWPPQTGHWARQAEATPAVLRAGALRTPSSRGRRMSSRRLIAGPPYPFGTPPRTTHAWVRWFSCQSSQAVASRLAGSTRSAACKGRFRGLGRGLCLGRLRAGACEPCCQVCQQDSLPVTGALGDCDGHGAAP